MRLSIAIFICKFVAFLGRLVGRGSSLPGKVALRICPDAIARLSLPSVIISVTGSNGKTSTAEMVAHIIASEGMRVGANREGSNQVEGIATLLLRSATYKGRVLCDALVLECDERYLAKIFAFVRPTALVVTNLCRDQLTRNGHHEFVQDCLRKAVGALYSRGDSGKPMAESHAGAATTGGAKLVLNADDPYVADLGDSGSDIVWFGVDIGAVPRVVRTGVYDDGAFCPRCKGRMEYDYRVVAHFGAFRCLECGYCKPKADVEVRLRGDVNGAYNTAAAVAAALSAGVDAAEGQRRLEGYELQGGRTMIFETDQHRVTLQIAKHENSLAYNNALSWIVGIGKPCAVLVFVNSISRKYSVNDVSWLWDIDFDILADDCVREVILAGYYSRELMMRFEMTGVDIGKCYEVSDLALLRERVLQCASEDVYVVTCFADKARVLKELNLLRQAQ